MTANAFIQVAEDPLRVVLAVTKTSLTWEILKTSRQAAVSLLAAENTIWRAIPASKAGAPWTSSPQYPIGRERTAAPYQATA